MNAEKRQYREYWITNKLKERGWSEKDIKRAKRYQRSEEFILVGVLWSLLILPLPLGLIFIIYGSYYQFQYRDLGETYASERTELKRELNRRDLSEQSVNWVSEQRRWRDRLPLPNRW
jgi:hypothetical protein